MRRHPQARPPRVADRVLLLATVGVLLEFVGACSKPTATMPLAASRRSVDRTTPVKSREYVVEVRAEGPGLFDGIPFEVADVQEITRLANTTIELGGAGRKLTPAPIDLSATPWFLVGIGRDVPFGRAAPLLDVLRQRLTPSEGLRAARLQLAANSAGTPQVFPLVLRSSLGTESAERLDRLVTVIVVCVHAMPDGFAPERPWTLIRTPPEAGAPDASRGSAVSLEFALELLERDPPVKSAVLVTRVVDTTPWQDVITLLEHTLPAGPDELQVQLLK